MHVSVPYQPLAADSEDLEFEYGPASFPRDDVPAGRLVEFSVVDPPHFPGTCRSVFVHLPDGIDLSVPQRCTIFQDAQWHLDPTFACRAQTVMENLVHDGHIPPMVSVFVEPGVFPDVQDPDMRKNRNVEYDTVSATYADFLTDEVLPRVRQHAGISDDPRDRALVGGSSSGNGSFTAAWHRPDQFRRVVGIASSFAQIPGGNPYPELIANTLPKPLRVFLFAGHRDLQWNEPKMNWFAENLTVAASLARAGYHLRLVVRDAEHRPTHGGSVLPDAIRWSWDDTIPDKTTADEVGLHRDVVASSGHRLRTRGTVGRRSAGRRANDHAP